MNTKRTIRYISSAIALLCLIIFGQNCAQGFNVQGGEDLSSLENGDDNLGLSESEKLGLIGRLYPEDYAFPLDSSSSLEFPKKLSQTKLFRDLAVLEPSEALIPFEVNMPLWSDGSIKKRWLVLPPGEEKIKFSASDKWVFPRGTIMIKQFDLRLSPFTVRRLETRIFVNEASGWAGYTYKWNASQTDADLLEGSAPVTESYTVSGVGGNYVQSWTYPSRDNCLQCHSSSGFGLGVRTAQFNRKTSINGTSIQQLQILKDLKLVENEIPDPSTLKAFPKPEDTDRSLNDRARAYLATNCSTCHNSTSPLAGVKFNDNLSLGEMNVVNVIASNNLGLGAGALRVKPGQSTSSTLFLRMTKTDATRMPKVGSAVIDTYGIALISQWIDSLPNQ